jgi:hypothetical protein
VAGSLQRLSKYDAVNLDGDDNTQHMHTFGASRPHVTMGIHMHNGSLSIVPEWAPSDRSLSMADFTGQVQPRGLHALQRDAPASMVPIRERDKRPRLRLRLVTEGTTAGS